MAEAILALKVALLKRMEGNLQRTENDYYACPHCSCKGDSVYHTTSKQGLLGCFSHRLKTEFLLQFEPEPEAAYLDKVNRHMNRMRNERQRNYQHYSSGNRKNQRRLRSIH